MSSQEPQDAGARGLEENSGDPAPNLFERLKNKLGLSVVPNFRHQLEHWLRLHKDGDENFSVPERTMLRNVLRFGALRVEDVMVPRADIIAIEEQSSVEELLRLFEAAGHSRLPIYREVLDEPLGMVHVKDLIRWIMHNSGKSGSAVVQNGASANGNDTAADNGKGNGHGTSRSGQQDPEFVLSDVDFTQTVASIRIKRDVLFVPPSMPVADLLLRMQTTHVHLALVVDEYGGTDGLVSIEDLVEEIVGEIEDEHDVADGPLLRLAGAGRFVADARMPIEDLQKELNLDLSLSDKEEDEVDTIGGLVFSIAGRVPTRGELIRHPSGLEFEVLDADPRRIKRLRIHRPSRVARDADVH